MVAAVAVVVERPGRLGVADPEVAQELLRCAGAVEEGRIRFEGEPAVLVVGEVQRAARISAQPPAAHLVGVAGTGETAVEERDFDLHHLGTAVGTHGDDRRVGVGGDEAAGIVVERKVVQRVV